jgi:drug/metabolite transporter (DMT)-like permease
VFLPAAPSSIEKSVASQGRLLVLAAGVLWSLGGLFIKSLALNPLTIVFYRSLFASVFFLPWARVERGHLSLPILVSVVSYTAALCAFVWANKLTTAANAIVLQYTAPMFVFIFSRLIFREPVSRANLAALLAGMVGVGIIFTPGRGLPDASGLTVALFSGFLFAVYMTNLRVLPPIRPATLTWTNNLVCWIVLLPLVYSNLSLSLGQSVALATMGVVQLGIPYCLFSKGIEKISLQEASLIVLVEPILNPIWVAVAVGELPSGATLLGGGVILFGLAFKYLQPS